MTVEITAIHQHSKDGVEYKVNAVKQNHNIIAYVVVWPGDAKTFGESDTLGSSAYNDAMALFKSKSGWTNHGRTRR